MAEFDLIARIRARVASRDDVVLGIGDDAALLAPPPGQHLVVTADTLNDGVHFPSGTAAADIGWKALAVNLSDLAAMGARPAWCTLSLSLPTADVHWLDGFLDGFLELAGRHGIVLVGGDTTRGPLAISVTAMGLVEAGAALRRDRARAGDDIWVTGTLGDAAAALAADGHVPLPEEGAGLPPGFDAGRVRARLARPLPRVAAGRALLGLAHACIDLSDGLLADLGHLCARSAVAARIDPDLLPASPALGGLASATRRHLQACGGDDYELCFTAAPRLRGQIELALQLADVQVTRIGRIEAGAGVLAVAADGTPWQPRRPGYLHFG